MTDTARVALECGNSPEVIFQHYRELVMPQRFAVDEKRCLVAAHARRASAGDERGAEGAAVWALRIEG